MVEGRRVALVTGSGRGIGRGIALHLARRGYAVVVHERDRTPEAEQVVANIESSGVPVELVIGNLKEEGVPARIVDEAVRFMGRLDVLVNNAGITVFTPFTDFAKHKVEEVISVDFLAPYWCAQRAAQVMIESGTKGNIVNITSVHYERTNDRDSIYGSMKAALARLTESLAFELAPQGIRVNAVAPGLILDGDPQGDWKRRVEAIEQAIPLGRTGRVQDVAQAVAWLVSDEASYVTGTTLRVDGGVNLPMTRAQIDGQPTFF